MPPLATTVISPSQAELQLIGLELIRFVMFKGAGSFNVNSTVFEAQPKLSYATKVYVSAISPMAKFGVEVGIGFNKLVYSYVKDAPSPTADKLTSPSETPVQLIENPL